MGEGMPFDSDTRPGQFGHDFAAGYDTLRSFEIGGGIEANTSDVPEETTEQAEPKLQRRSHKTYLGGNNPDCGDYYDF